MSFSLVLPIYNEQDVISVVYKDICAKIYDSFELIFVDDGSTDNTLLSLSLIKQQNPHVKILSLKENKGQSWAITEGVKLATHNKIVIMDSDGQYDPADIPKLLNELNSNFRLISGKRDNRKDSFLYKTASFYGNKCISLFLGTENFDLGCGLKVAFKEDLLAIPYFKHIHRYYPIVYHFSNLKVKSININHKEREAGESKYTLMKVFNIFPRLIWLKIKKPAIKKSNNVK